MSQLGLCHPAVINSPQIPAALWLVYLQVDFTCLPHSGVQTAGVAPLVHAILMVRR